MYYERALDEGEVIQNIAASKCIEQGEDPLESCPTDYYYNAGTSNDPINCLTGEAGVTQVQLDREHEYPGEPLPGCPINPGTQLGATNHGGATAADNPNAGWIEAMPTAGGKTDTYLKWKLENVVFKFQKSYFR